MLDRPVSDCRLVMVFDGRWKYVRAEGFRPMLYDLETDPQEFHDLGAHPDTAGERARLEAMLTDWALRPHNRVTVSDARIAAARGGELSQNIFIGFWDEPDIDAARTEGESGN